MLSPKYNKYLKRIESLIKEGRNIISSIDDSSIVGKEQMVIHSWITKANNIVRNVFGENSTQFMALYTLTSPLTKTYKLKQLYPILGILEGAYDDLKHGFLMGQEFIVAAEVFDSIMERAAHLNDMGYKDPAAVLVRTVIEDALKRIAKDINIEIEGKKASRINNDLKSEGRFSKPTWSRVQSWLDIGNAAAHGDFEVYSQEEVKLLIDDVVQFLAVNLI